MVSKGHLHCQDEVMMMKEQHEEDSDQDNKVLLWNKNRILIHNNQY
jgi:hypothetical protein